MESAWRLESPREIAFHPQDFGACHLGRVYEHFHDVAPVHLLKVQVDM